MYDRQKWTLTAWMAAALMLGGCERIQSWVDNNGQEPEGFVQTVTPGKDDGSVAMLLPDFTQLVAKEGAAVVNIQASRMLDGHGAAEQLEMDPFPEDDPFYEFFKRLVPQAPPSSQDDDDEFNFGSGFVISADGYILTNAHVLAGMNHIKVLFNDKREYSARLVGADAQSDVALLKIDAQSLPVVTIGNPKDLQVGEWVAAIGAPFGFDNSVTAGIVSAKGRSLPNENYTPFIQTDVAINPGNSGGPLFNLKGQVIGINSQIYSRSGGFMGISFAIPIDVAMNVAEQLKTTGKVQRGRLGVVIQEVSYDLAQSFGLEQANGALISQVVPGGPADKAGLQVGDIVQSVNGETVKNSSDLPVMVGILAPGKEVTLGIWRQGRSESVSVVLDSMGAQGSASAGAQAAPAPGGEHNGFRVGDWGLALQPSENGLVVLHAQGRAARAGLRRGDVIVAVGRVAVHNETELKAAAAAAGSHVPLLVKRGHSTLFLAINPE